MSTSNMFGLVRGKFIGEPPSYVDKTKSPALSIYPEPKLTVWLANIPLVLLYSPNFVWAVISLLCFIVVSL